MKKVILFIGLLITTKSYSQTIPSYIPKDSLVAWYPFNGNANDESGNANNCTVNGAVLTTDRFGNQNSAYSFNGSTNYIASNTQFFNIGFNEFTISCWINSASINNPNNGNNDQMIVNTIPHNGIALTDNWGQTGKYSIWVNTNPSVASWDISLNTTSNTTVAANVWRHMVLVKKGTNYFLYINSVLDLTLSQSMVVGNHFCQMIMGHCGPASCDEGFIGTLDDYGVWNRALTSSEVKQVYLGCSPVTKQPINQAVKLAATAQFTVNSSNPGATFQWFSDMGSGVQKLSNGGQYNGVNNGSLTVTNVGMSNNKQHFRCLVQSSSCGSDTSNDAILTIINTTGIQESYIHKDVLIYPNPANENITIKVAGGIDFDYKIVDNLGRVIIAGKTLAETTIVPVNSLPSGMYTVYVGELSRYKMMKN